MPVVRDLPVVKDLPVARDSVISRWRFKKLMIDYGYRCCKGCGTLKHFPSTAYPWMPLWYLEMKLQRRRMTDPALSWVDGCEAPSIG
jgi:hypothetical protein